MTRINVVPVEELCDKHLLAEHRELTRIPNNICKGKYSLKGQPSEYVLGAGHVKFFYDKLCYLHTRYMQLQQECERRGFNVTWIWPCMVGCVDFTKVGLWKNYIPTEDALAINRARITERMPKSAKHTTYKARHG